MILQKLAKINFLRSLIFPILRRFDFNIKISHDLTQKNFYLKTWSHKGYWFYGSRRESNEIKMFKKLVFKNYNVLEIGAHIGYLSQFFEKLTYPDGKIIVIEPSNLNQKYLEKNVKNSTKILKLALSNKTGNAKLFLDSFGGFTNSLKKDFTSEKNIILNKTQFTPTKSIHSIEVKVSTIDEVCQKFNFKPDFIKIDVEGSELEVLKGGFNTLKVIQSIMVEISYNHENIFSILRASNFEPINNNGDIIKWGELDKEVSKNYFFKKSK